MRFQLVDIEFEKKITCQVVFPLDATQEQIELMAAKQAQELDAWDNPDWTSTVCHSREILVSNEACAIQEIRKLRAGPFGRDVLVVSDDQQEFSHPIDATWWQLSEEDLLEQQRKERLLQDINHPDQLTLFTS